MAKDKVISVCISIGILITIIILITLILNLIGLNIDVSNINCLGKGC